MLTQLFPDAKFAFNWSSSFKWYKDPDPTTFAQLGEMGFKFVTVGGDTRFLTMGAAAAIKEMRGDAPVNPARAGASSVDAPAWRPRRAPADR